VAKLLSPPPPPAGSFVASHIFLQLIVFSQNFSVLDCSGLKQIVLPYFHSVVFVLKQLFQGRIQQKWPLCDSVTGVKSVDPCSFPFQFSSSFSFFFIFLFIYCIFIGVGEGRMLLRLLVLPVMQKDKQNDGFLDLGACNQVNLYGSASSVMNAKYGPSRLLG